MPLKTRVNRKKRRGTVGPLPVIVNERRQKIVLFGLICFSIYSVFGWASKMKKNWKTNNMVQFYKQSHPSTPEPSSFATCTLDQSNLEHTRVYQHQHGLGNETVNVESFCQDTNYLIVIPSGRGFGAMIRSVITYVGMNFDKTIIVHWPWNTGFMTGVYNASHCPNRNAPSAWECFFEPVSKCTLSDALKVAGANDINDIPFWYDAPKSRVVKVSKFIDYYYGGAIPKDIFETIQPNFLVSHMDRNPVKTDPWQSQVTRYLLRFNLQTRALLAPHMQNVHNMFKERSIDSSRSVALMIRGSDKCNEDVSGKQEAHETDCLPLRAYLDSVHNVWRWDQEIKDVIVTSEDSRYIKAVKKFRDGPPPPGFESSSSPVDGDGGGHKFAFHFNEQDIQQGSSLIANAIRAGTITSHFDLVKSMWTTIEMAVQARYMIINCGSFFHALAVSYRESRCQGNGKSPPVIFCLDHAPKKNVSGFDVNTIRSGGSYEGRWVYQP